MSNKVCFEYQLHWSENPHAVSSSKTERYRLVVETSIERPLTVTRPEHAEVTLFIEEPGPTGEPQWRGWRRTRALPRSADRLARSSRYAGARRSRRESLPVRQHHGSGARR